VKGECCVALFEANTSGRTRRGWDRGAGLGSMGRGWAAVTPAAIAAIALELNWMPRLPPAVAGR